MPKKSTRKKSTKRSRAKKSTRSRRSKKEDEIILTDGDDEELEEEEDLDTIEDEMLAEDDGKARSPDEVRTMLWDVMCSDCDGNKISCKVRDDFGCPPGKGG